MNDLNLGPDGVHGPSAQNLGRHDRATITRTATAVIYPTLVRLAQEWVMREVLVDKQGNFGSIAGLGAGSDAVHRGPTVTGGGRHAGRPRPRHGRLHSDLRPAATRNRSCCRRGFPICWSTDRPGIAVGMATSIPPHNLSEVADAVQLLIDDPDATHRRDPGGDARDPTSRRAGSSAGRMGIRQGYMTGRSTLTLRAKVGLRDGEEHRRDRRPRRSPILKHATAIREKLEDLVREDKTQGDLEGRRLHRPQDPHVAGPAAHLPQARCRPRGRAESALQVLAAANDRQRHPAGAGRQSARDAHHQAICWRSSSGIA